MTVSILRTVDDWWVHTPTGAARIATPATTTGELIADRTAIHAAMEGNPNLILLDLRLPDMNGIEVARELQKIPETAHISVIAGTSN